MSFRIFRDFTTDSLKQNMTETIPVYPADNLGQPTIFPQVEGSIIKAGDNMFISDGVQWIQINGGGSVNVDNITLINPDPLQVNPAFMLPLTASPSFRVTKSGDLPVTGALFDDSLLGWTVVTNWFNAGDPGDYVGGGVGPSFVPFLTSGVYIIPVTGIYTISCQITWNGGNTGDRFVGLINAVPYIKLYELASLKSTDNIVVEFGTFSQNFSTDVSLQAGNQIFIGVQANSDDNVTSFSAQCLFCLRFVMGTA
jgi:hypothetical protein